jgi:hypothetical protein
VFLYKPKDRFSSLLLSRGNIRESPLKKRATIILIATLYRHPVISGKKKKILPSARIELAASEL